ncbi:alternative ribosome rescue aminoacyl-tRNA hydrolase ArfB [Teredinibacter sp. KSP-S5-2]|uniref:alternative ribosome rescue aminoacyl-tRNA hydrolase ArfB n=1 Tax=Teredinibacter sp. KSP-S5-2 TaxID=3034506 RepID=UPI002934C368|nr:alternative ribosome rescue aminoacyl-tRNA hydrolase ArfB [Teredinibacter sp. KSP-S5-2]WNO10261.1 alternative ribosome rescue aminoacyl-tRNA hydrolase ArfB [Teredinibacter sp. KSP-S5-2]
MIFVTNHIQLSDEEIEFQAIRAQGAGGQNVNKVSSAIHLKFNIQQSSLPPYIQQRLFAVNDQRISKDGVITIKAQSFRTQEKNKRDAIDRLAELIRSVSVTQKRRIPTKPSKSSRNKRMDKKTNHGKTKQLRGKVTW